MKKRQMKKKIPRDTEYCGNCPHIRFLGTKDLNRTNCKHADVCDSEGGCDCQIHIYRCNYMKFTDHEEETLLWDGCKECGEKFPTHRSRFKKTKFKG